ncbi:hypothetical protein BD560DRAFT_438267 [Blakeslea trispora]|nr:hypothetical protein BD560DRAFT_438267 [Blakeslea trispora]
MSIRKFLNDEEKRIMLEMMKQGIKMSQIALTSGLEQKDLESYLAELTASLLLKCTPQRYDVHCTVWGFATFAEKYQHLTVEDKKKVGFTEESSFKNGKNSVHVMVWRLANEKYLEGCLAPTFKSARTSLMVWGSIRAEFKTSPASVTAASINNSSVAPTDFVSTSALSVSDPLSLVYSYKTATEKRKYLQKYIRDEVLKLYQQRCPYEVKSVPWSLLLSSDSFIKLHSWTRVSGDLIDNRYRPQCLDLEVLKELAINNVSTFALLTENNATSDVAINGLLLDNLSPLGDQYLVLPLCKFDKEHEEHIDMACYGMDVSSNLSLLALDPSIKHPFVESHMQYHAEVDRTIDNSYLKKERMLFNKKKPNAGKRIRTFRR